MSVQPIPSDQPVQVEEEIWKPIPDAPGYDISNNGRVRSWWIIGGRGRTGDRPRVIRDWAVHKGYRGIRVKYAYGWMCRHVGNMVLRAFIGPPPDGMECCHENGDKADNCLRNLRWDTSKNNNRDKLKHGTNRQGRKVNGVKLNEDQVRYVRAKYAAGEVTMRDLSAEFGVKWQTLQDAINRRTWKHVE